MWIRLQLDPLLPPVAILIGSGGTMYVRLLDIGKLLNKSSSYTYRDKRKHLAVLGKDVLPSDGSFVAPETLKTPFVPISLALKLISSENVAISTLFMKQLSEGIAHKRGIYRFVNHSREAPFLICVDKMDDNCVSVPDYIEQFIKDLERSRADFAKTLPPSLPKKRKSEPIVSILKKRRLQETASRSDDAELEEGRSNSPAESDATMEIETNVAHLPVEPQLEQNLPVEPQLEQNLPVEPQLEQNLSVEPQYEIITPVEFMPEPNSSTETMESKNRIPVDFPIKSSEDNLMETSPLTIISGFVVGSVTFQQRPFPKPGDLVVPVSTLPSRVFLMLGEGDVNTKNESQK